MVLNVPQDTMLHAAQDNARQHPTGMAFISPSLLQVLTAVQMNFYMKIRSRVPNNI